MRAPSVPRHQGKITTWKDDEGYGFITPNGGGPTVFVHVKAFPRHGARPGVGSIVTYHLSANAKGQPRAEHVIFAGTRAAPRSAAPGSGRTLMATAAFALVLVIAVPAGRLPWLALGVYAVLSLVTFIAYAADKSAARQGRWRTPEAKLHVLALCGGWPGALLAQGLLRHKSSKASFRSAFALTVVANCLALGALLSPQGSALLRSIGLL